MNNKNKSASGGNAMTGMKTVKKMGVEMTYHPKAEKVVQEALAHARKARRRRQAAKRAQKNPPDLKPNKCLVAFIDILGFGAEIKRAKTAADLLAVHEKIRRVQEHFLKESAADDPAEQRELNAGFGRRVLAMSDAVIVVYSMKSEARKMLGGYDHFGMAISELILAQTLLLQNHGIFVRGGISIGSFFFEEDVLLSPAVACAYELESKHAEHPVLVLTEKTRRKLLAQPAKAVYAKDADLAPKAFRRHGRRKAQGEKLYFLDYLNSFETNTDLFSREAHAAWLAARRQRDFAKAKEIKTRSGKERLAAMWGRHRQRIESAYHATTHAKVRDKYRWLMGYHNRTLAKAHGWLSEELFKLEDFRRGTDEGAGGVSIAKLIEAG